MYFFEKTRCDDTITSLIKFYLHRLSFINKPEVRSARSLLGLGPLIKEITGKFIEIVKRKKP